jgi:uncharacterized membrane protein
MDAVNSRNREFRHEVDDLALARALHVLGVVIWIGGLAMVTTVALPAVRRGQLGADRLAAFRAFEHRFVWQARVAMIVVGLTGFYLTMKLDLWGRFHDFAFWWLHAMVCVWLIFAFMLFVGEPLILHRRFPRWAAKSPEAAFAWLHRAHIVLLTLSLVTIFGAVAGSHGWSVF